MPKSQQASSIAFAQHASGSSGSDSISIQTSDTDEASSSSTTGTFGSWNSSRNSHQSSAFPSTTPSVGSDNGMNHYIPTGTKKFLLLCVNTRIGLIKLGNVDVINVSDDEEMFNRLRNAYEERRGTRGLNPLIKPKTMHYVEVFLPSTPGN